MAWRAKLTVLAGGCDLREHVLIHVAFSIAVAHVEPIDFVDDLGEKGRPWNLETSIAHMARVRCALSAECSEEWKNVPVDYTEHLRTGEMFEARPAQVRKCLAPLVL